MTSPCSRFYKIVTRKYLEDRNLMIPNNFTRRFGGGLPNPIFLKPPDGLEWKLYWTKVDGKIWFQKGWKEFDSYYSLDYGHLVVFEYHESSHFEVHIFDTSALEIEYPFHNQISNAESVEILNEQSPCKKKRLKSPMSSELHKSRSESNPNMENLLQHAQTKGSQSEGTKFEMPIIASINQELDVATDGKSTSPLTSPSPKTTRNMDEAKKFTSENPSFIINIRQSSLKRSHPSLSYVFVRKYFKLKKQNVMIKFGKKLWPVKVLFYPSTGHASFSAGWSLFAEESKLQAGDACVFELIDREDAVLDLHIFRGHN